MVKVVWFELKPVALYLGIIRYINRRSVYIMYKTNVSVMEQINYDVDLIKILANL